MKYSKNKEQLAKAGIHTTRHTPGKLITAKGHIDGYLSAYGTVWGKIGMTGEQAQKAMGFTPKKDAKGVLLTRRKYIDKNGKVKQGIFATSLMPRGDYLTNKQKPTREAVSVIGKMASKYLRDLIYPIWEPLVINKNRKPYSGYHYFQMLNIKNIGAALRWRNLIISKGNLKPLPLTFPNWYDYQQKMIHITLPLTILREPISIHQPGIGIFDILSGDFFLLPPHQLSQLSQFPFSEGVDPDKVGRRGSPPDGVFKLTWKIQNFRKYFTYQERYFRKETYRFLIFSYYRKPISSSITPCFSTGAKQNKRSWALAQNIYDYSPSLSSKIRPAINRTHRTHGISIALQIYVDT